MSRVTSLITRFKCGSQSAYRDLFMIFFDRQVNTTQKRLNHVKSQVDAEVVTLSAWWSLWKEVLAGQTLAEHLSDRERLLRTLALIVKQKITRGLRDAQRLKRDERRTIRESDLDSDVSSLLATVTDSSADPSWAACFQDVWAEVNESLRPMHQKVLEMKLANFSDAEIAVKLGRSKRSIERNVSEIRSTLFARFEESQS